MNYSIQNLVKYAYDLKMFWAYNTYYVEQFHIYNVYIIIRILEI